MTSIRKRYKKTPSTSFFGGIAGWFNRAWEAVKPGPDSWKGAALGLPVSAAFAILWAAYLVFQAPPRIIGFLTFSIQFIAIAAIAADSWSYWSPWSTKSQLSAAGRWSSQ